MPSQIRLIPLHEIILGPEPNPGPILRIGPPPRREGDRFPAVIVTLDRRLIAGRTSLNAYKEGGYPTIPCRIVDTADLDMVLTSIHNRILFGDLPAEELDLQLGLYAELCWYQQTRGAADGRRSTDSPQSPDANESDTADKSRNLNGEY